MADTSHINQARAMSPGARFRRTALQVNPWSYLVEESKPTDFSDAASYHAAIVEACLDEGIEVIAVTDHFTYDEAAVDLVVRAQQEGIVAFPGFEAKSSDGVHVLCIFEQDTPPEQIRSYIGACGIHALRDRNEPGKVVLADLLEMVRSWAGLTVAAHVEKNGLLTILKGKQRIKAWRDEHLLAASISHDFEELDEAHQHIILQKDAEHRREHPVAVINASDVNDPQDLTRRSSWSWLKMSTDGLEGLHQAFLDPESRVRSSYDELPREYPRIEAIAWEGGFLDGQTIRLSQNLNVLIGGRGAGKSTIVESVRFALGIEPIGDEAARLHRGIVEKVLGPGTTVTLAVSSPYPSPKEYVVGRTVGDEARVHSGGARESIEALDTLPGIELLGQHEIAELASDRTRRLHLLERFLPLDLEREGRHREALQAVKRNRAALKDAESTRDDLSRQIAELPTLEERLERFREAGLERRLKRRTQYQTEDALVSRARERTSAVDDALAVLEEELPSDLAFLSDTKVADLPSRDMLIEAREVIERLDARRTAVRDDLLAAAAEAEAKLDSIRSNWETQRDAEQADLDKLLREAQAEGTGAAEFLQLSKRVEELQGLVRRAEVAGKRVDELRDERGNALREWASAEESNCKLLDRTARKISKDLRPRVRVRVTHWADTAELEKLLRSRVGGQVKPLVDRIARSAPCSPVELAELCRDGADAVRVRFELTDHQAATLAELDTAVLRDLEELVLGPAVDIDLNVKRESGGKPNWRALEDLSTGQRATAILLLLLLDSDGPLIVDQPEDDLDNQFITETVVNGMRKAKQRRQFIFSTHNANIPVLGDAEQILVIEAQGDPARGPGRGSVAHTGSIDTREVRLAVERLLEGGESAFRTRHRKYGF